MSPVDKNVPNEMPEPAETPAQPLDARTQRLLAAAAAMRPLPDALRTRLLELPREAEDGEARTRRFEQARAEGRERAAGGASPVLRTDVPLPQARTHRAIARWVAEGRRPAHLPLALRARLLAIGSGARRALPVWLDTRWAMTACLLLTLISTLVVGDASALWGEKVPDAREMREEWQVQLVEELRSSGEDVWSSLRGIYNRGRQVLSSRGEELRDVYEEKLRQFNQKGLDQRLVGEPSTRGTNHGK